MAEVVARAGTWSAPLADPRVIESLIATLSYRLEPEGFATRFPVLLTEVLAGRLAPENAPAAWQELDTVIREARQLPAEKLICSRSDRRPADLGELPGYRGGASVHDALLTSTGRPLLDVIAEGVQASHGQGSPLVIRTGQVRRTLLRGILLLVLGAIGTYVAWRYFPDTLITWRSYSHSPGTRVHGSPLWAWLAILGVAGGFDIALALSPRLTQFFERHVMLFRVLSAVAACAWVLSLWE
jgi:immunity protein 70 of polymorphic toxin system